MVDKAVNQSDLNSAIKKTKDEILLRKLTWSTCLYKDMQQEILTNILFFLLHGYMSVFQIIFAPDVRACLCS